MAVFMLTAQLSGQKTDPLIVLSAAFIFIIAFNPLELFMPGFQLSFGAVFGMVTAGAWLYNKTPRWPKLLRDTASANFGASLGTMPVLASRFYSVSVVSFFGNFFIVPASSAATVLITIAVCLGAIWQTLSVPFVFLATGFIRIIAGIVWLFNQIPFASLPVGALSTVAVGLLFVCMMLISQYALIAPKLKKILAASLIAVIVIVMVFSYLPYDGLYLAYLDVGQGDSAFVRTPSGNCFLVDTGDQWSARDIDNFLDYKGFRLDFVFITHPHDDHMGSLAELVRQGRVKKIYTTEYAAAKLSKLQGVEVEALQKGDNLCLGDVTIEVLHPDAGATDMSGSEEDENDGSLVLGLAYRKHYCLFTGDISQDAEKTILYELQKTDIMKAAHHGANTSSSAELLQKTQPAFTVISVGANKYGHPGKEALLRLSAYGRVFRTDQNHAVEFYIKDTVKAQPLYGN
jgi:competence protein ComEC